MNPWDTQLESYRLRVYTCTLATVRCQIQQVENPIPAMEISMEAVHVDNTICLDHLASKVALHKRELWSTDPYTPPDQNYIDDEISFGISKGSGHCEDECDEAGSMIPSPGLLVLMGHHWTQEVWPANQECIEGKGDDGHDVDPDQEKEALRANHGAMQDSVDWGHSTGEADHWTADFRPVKWDDRKASATASDQSEVLTVLLSVISSQCLLSLWWECDMRDIAIEER